MTAITTERKRDYLGPVTNTEVWDFFKLRADDVIVTTPPKSGTTWVLNIIMMLIYGRVVPEAGNREDSPWIDAGFRDQRALAAAQDAVERRRCLKSHTPMDGIAFGAGPTYIAVYRHPVDVFFSFRAHVENMKNKSVFAEICPDDVSAGFARFLEHPLTESGTDDLSLASILHHYQQSLARRGTDNVHLLHYADLSRDLHGQVKRLARILGISLPDQVLDDITEANTFASMRKVAEASPNRFDDTSAFRDSAQFFASGSSNKWEGHLSREDLTRYDAICAAELAPKDVAWLNWGERGRA